MEGPYRTLAFSVGKEEPTKAKSSQRRWRNPGTQFPRNQGRFQQMGLTFPGTRPPGSSAHLGSTSSCQGPATLCQDRHTCTWGSGWRSEEQEGTGTHSPHWAGHSAHRHLQLRAQREMARESVGAQTGNARFSLLPGTRPCPLSSIKTLSLLLLSSTFCH